MTNFKLVIHCLNCLCDFELRGDYISKSEALFCPNCNQSFPSKEFEILKSSLGGLAELSSKIVSDKPTPLGFEGFELSMKATEIKSFNDLLP